VKKKKYRTEVAVYYHKGIDMQKDKEINRVMRDLFWRLELDGEWIDQGVFFDALNTRVISWEVTTSQPLSEPIRIEISKAIHGSLNGVYLFKL
jgi:hypothetical protein